MVKNSERSSAWCMKEAELARRNPRAVTSVTIFLEFVYIQPPM